MTPFEGFFEFRHIMLKIHFRYTIWLLSILLLLYATQLEAASEKSLPTLLVTIAQADNRGLQADVFRIPGTHINQQRTDILAEKKVTNWQTAIHPQPTLTWHVKRPFTGSDVFGVYNTSQPMWAQISKQTDLASPAANRTIPIQIYRHAKAIVCMRSVTNGNEKQVSGFFLRIRKGLILTTAHDLAVFQYLTVVLSNGHEISGQVIQLDQQLDLALVRVASTPEAGIILNKSRNLLNLGDRLYTIGCSSNGRGKLSSGVIDGPPWRVGGQLLWQAKMAILPGNSGSPVLNDKGRLVAVVKGRHRVEEQMGFLIPIETIITFIEAYIEYIN